MTSELTDSVIETIQSAARRLTGFLRRQFAAEMALKYCDGRSRRAEAVFGWGRAAVETGLNERCTGLRCYDGFSARGRRPSEERDSELVAAIHALVEPTSQADPKFQTPSTGNPITAPGRSNRSFRTPSTSKPARMKPPELSWQLGLSVHGLLKNEGPSPDVSPSFFSRALKSGTHRVAASTSVTKRLASSFNRIKRSQSA